MGQSERAMGQAFKRLGWGLAREGNTVNQRNTLNRKYLSQAIDGSLQCFGLDHDDLVYCHRPDPHTSNEETV